MAFTARIAIVPKANNLGTYEILDLITVDGRSYLSLKNGNTDPVTVAASWMRVTENNYDIAVKYGYEGTEQQYAELFSTACRVFTTTSAPVSPRDGDKWIPEDIEYTYYKGAWVALGDSLSINNIFKPNQTGANISAIKKAVRNIYFNFAKTANKRYYFTVLRRNNIADGATTKSSQISLYSTDMDGVSNPTTVARYDIAGDPNTNTYQLLNFGNTYVLIDWQYLADNTKFIQMFAGYELDDMCFDKRNSIAMTLSIDDAILRIQALENIPKYPYKQNQVGTKIPQLIKAIKNVFINPDIVDTNKTYSISSVRRNNIAYGETKKTSQVAIWSRNNSDGAIALVQQWVINGDAANGSNQLLDSTNFRVLINWDSLPDNYSVTNMITPVIGNYELDAMCFDKRNILYQAPQPIDLSKNELVYNKPTLTDGFVDIRYGSINVATAFGSTDYIPVYPGQIIRYVGGMYGNAGICGYPTKSTTGYVVLHNSSIETNNTDFEFTIPAGVNYIRACCYKPTSPTVELYYSKSYNYALFASVGLTDNIEVLNIIFKGGQLEIKSLISDAEKQKARWIELKDNYDFPSKGIFIGRQNEDVVISINGITTKLNS